MRQLTRAELIEQAIKVFLEKVEMLDRAKDVKRTAEINLANATNDLGKLLIPKNLDQKEKYHYYFGNALFAAERTDGPGSGFFDYKIIMTDFEEEK